MLAFLSPTQYCYIMHINLQANTNGIFCFFPPSHLRNCQSKGSSPCSAEQSPHPPLPHPPPPGRLRSRTALLPPDGRIPPPLPIHSLWSRENGCFFSPAGAPAAGPAVLGVWAECSLPLALKVTWGNKHKVAFCVFCMQPFSQTTLKSILSKWPPFFQTEQHKQHVGSRFPIFQCSNSHFFPPLWQHFLQTLPA